MVHKYADYTVPERLRPALAKVLADRERLFGVKVAIPEAEMCKVENLSEACRGRDGQFRHVDLGRAIEGEMRGNYRIVGIIGPSGVEPVE